MARILITGANGHLGANTVRRLLHHGHEVVPFVRHNADLRGIEKLGLAYRYGDIMDCESLTTAADGCDVIIHTATLVKTWAKNPDEIMQPAFVGTRNVFTAAQQTGIRRLVYTSSVGAVGPAQSPNTLHTELDWHEEAQNPYYVAKLRSEQEALHLSETLAVPTIRLCPAQVLGPYDYRITPSTAVILGFINGTQRSWEGGWNIVDVRDVAEVHAAAVDCGEPGKRYVVGGTNLRLTEVGQIVKRLTGITPKHFGGGRKLSLLIGYLFELGARVTGSPPAMSWSSAHADIERYWYFDSTRTNRTFGLVPRGDEETIRDCIRWLLHLGAIRAPLPRHFSDKLAPDSEW